VRIRHRSEMSYGSPFDRLQDFELNQLATFNAERARGLLHDPAYVERMEKLQARWDKSMQPHAEPE